MSEDTDHAGDAEAHRLGRISAESIPFCHRETGDVMRKRDSADANVSRRTHADRFALSLLDAYPYI